MKYDPEKHHRRSIRLREYDYTAPGWYFITICAADRECLFGNIHNGRMILNEFGKIVKSEWIKTPEIRSNVELDEFIVMPNHFHNILIINYRVNRSIDNAGGDDRRGVLQYAPTVPPDVTPQLKSPSQTVGAIIRGFKSAVTKQINHIRQTPGVPVWQRNYYEHIIRNDRELYEIRKYIRNNPLKWELDRENPDNQKP